MEELSNRLMTDITSLGLNDGFELEIRPYSKTYFGVYNPNCDKIVLYVYEDKNCKHLYPYWNILVTFIHEIAHHIQWTDPDFVRVQGVMHNEQFYRIFNRYKERAKALMLLREVQNEKAG